MIREDMKPPSHVATWLHTKITYPDIGRMEMKSLWPW